MRRARFANGVLRSERKVVTANSSFCSISEVERGLKVASVSPVAGLIVAIGMIGLPQAQGCIVRSIIKSVALFLLKYRSKMTVVIPLYHLPARPRAVRIRAGRPQKWIRRLGPPRSPEHPGALDSNWRNCLPKIATTWC